MNDDQQTLRALVRLLAAVPTVTGTASLVRGTSIIRGTDGVSPSVDSEHRFLAAWWTALGPLLWRISRDVEQERPMLDAVSATIFVGGMARLLSMRHLGRPHPLYQVLTGIELALPAVLWTWPRPRRARAR
jgi:hypothetical protein